MKKWDGLLTILYDDEDVQKYPAILTQLDIFREVICEDEHSSPLFADYSSLSGWTLTYIDANSPILNTPSAVVILEWSFVTLDFYVRMEFDSNWDYSYLSYKFSEDGEQENFLFSNEKELRKLLEEVSHIAQDKIWNAKNLGGITST